MLPVFPHRRGTMTTRRLPTLGDIPNAVGSLRVFAIAFLTTTHRTGRTAVNLALQDAIAEAERRLPTRIGAVTVGALSWCVALSRPRRFTGFERRLARARYA